MFIIILLFILVEENKITLPHCQDLVYLNNAN